MHICTELQPRAKEGVHLLASRLLKERRGAVFIEAFISILFILYVSLMVGQIFLVFHATTAAKTAAMRAARAVALDPSLRLSAGQGAYDAQRARYIGALQWPAAPDCVLSGNDAVCRVVVGVPTFLPGGALFFGNGLRGPIQVEESGRFPVVKRS